MNKLILLCILICNCFYGNFVYSQTEAKGQQAFRQEVKSQNSSRANETNISTVNEKAQFDALFSELEGTFQFKSIKPDYSPLLSLELLQRIKNSRDNNTTIYIDVNEFMKVMIPSKNDIQSNHFEKLELITYISNF